MRTFVLVLAAVLVVPWFTSPAFADLLTTKAGMTEVEEAEWERRGEADGQSSTGMKSLLAGGGGCCLGTISGCLLGIPVAFVGSAAGCISGHAVATIIQQPPNAPIGDRIGREAYLRGFDRGLRRSNTTAALVGTGTSILALIGIVLLATITIH